MPPCCAGLTTTGATNATPDFDPVAGATALLIGRGAAYPALSVSLGERMGVVGALSIEAAAKHLNVRDIDGIVLGEGFSPRVVDAFLTVLAEDTRFRNLPIVVTSDGVTPAYDLPNLEMHTRRAARVAANALPLIRQIVCRRHSIRRHHDGQVAEARVFGEHREECIHHPRLNPSPRTMPSMSRTLRCLARPRC